mmetsp:Transcript_91494/g.296116  ORF Transcript_91494/g.296116 Transcript_91494/m.296116 type:complete len:247 (+) Transcript_91494:761-1501(+)
MGGDWSATGIPRVHSSRLLLPSNGHWSRGTAKGAAVASARRRGRRRPGLPPLHHTAAAAAGVGRAAAPALGDSTAVALTVARLGADKALVPGSLNVLVVLLAPSASIALPLSSLDILVAAAPLALTPVVHDNALGLKLTAADMAAHLAAAALEVLEAAALRAAARMRGEGGVAAAAGPAGRTGLLPWPTPTVLPSCGRVGLVGPDLPPVVLRRPARSVARAAAAPVPGGASPGVAGAATAPPGVLV